jgi:hypothetical protein
MRMIHVQYGDGGAVCSEDICKLHVIVFETRGKKHEDMKHMLELQVRKSPQLDRPPSRPTTRHIMSDPTLRNRSVFSSGSLFSVTILPRLRQPRKVHNCLFARILDWTRS